METVDFIKITMLAFAFLVLAPLQNALAPPDHYAPANSVFSRKRRNRIVAFLFRVVATALCCFVGLSFLGLSQESCCFSLFIAQLMVEIPRIYNYRLFKAFENSIRFLRLVQALLSVGITLFACLACMRIASWSCLIFLACALLADVAGNVINSFLERDAEHYSKEDCLIDKYVTYKNIDLEMKRFNKRYAAFVEQSARTYGLDAQTLKMLITIIRHNGNGACVQIVENIAVRLFPGLCERWDISIGLCQVSIENIRRFFPELTKQDLRLALRPETNIDICAFVLRGHIDQFFVDYQKVFYDDEENRQMIGGNVETQVLTARERLCISIASRYLTGYELSRTKCVPIYASLLLQCNVEACLTEEQQRAFLLLQKREM